MAARLVFCLFLASCVQSSMGRRAVKTPGSVLTEEKADTWSGSSNHGCLGGYCFESSCREEYREGWSSEEREECFNGGYNMRCDAGYARGGQNTCYWARVHCAVKWSSWSACSAPCGGGTTTRTSSVVRHAAHGGQACPASSESMSCNAAPCPVDCEGSWGDFTECSKSCGGGTQSRTFGVTTTAAHNGDSCPADETQTCNSDACPKDCEGSWGEWSSCSKTCGVGERSRDFIVSADEENGGTECPASPIKEHCNEDACPQPVVVEEKVADDEPAQEKVDDDLDLELDVELDEEEEDEWEKDPAKAVQKCRGLEKDSVTGEELPKSKWKKARATCVCNLANKEGLVSVEKARRCKSLRMDAYKVAGPFMCMPKKCGDTVTCLVAGPGSWPRC